MSANIDMAKAEASGFEAIVAAIQKRDTCGAIDALRKARHEYPAEFARYQEAGPTMIEKAAERSQRERDKVAKAKSSAAAWDAAVDKLRGDGEVGFAEATAQAKKIHADLFREAFGA